MSGRTLLAATNLCIENSVGGGSQRAIEWFGINLCSWECCAEELWVLGLWADKPAGMDVNYMRWGGGLT